METASAAATVHEYKGILGVWLEVIDELAHGVTVHIYVLVVVKNLPKEENIT